MKKLISLILALTCLSFCFGCNSNTNKYSYSSTSISSGDQSVNPIQANLWFEECNSNENNKTVFSEQGTGAYSILFGDTQAPIEAIPRLKVTDKVILKKSPQCIEYGSPELYDLNYEKIFFPLKPNWSNLQLLPPGEYILTFKEYIETPPDSQGIYQHACYENIFIIVIGDGENSEITSKNVVYDGEEYCIILPISKVKVRVFDLYIRYLPLVDDELLKTAEEAIKNSVADYTSTILSFEVDDSGYLCLCSSKIVDIVPPATDENGNVILGCDSDHKHLFFKERISK